MDNARDIAEDRQQDIDPEVLANPNLQEYTQGWEKYGDYDTQQIHLKTPYVDLPHYYADALR
jgi:hypothetical protein